MGVALSLRERSFSPGPSDVMSHLAKLLMAPEAGATLRRRKCLNSGAVKEEDVQTSGVIKRVKKALKEDFCRRSK